jgi:hypothetical protein
MKGDQEAKAIYSFPDFVGIERNHQISICFDDIRQNSQFILSQHGKTSHTPNSSKNYRPYPNNISYLRVDSIDWKFIEDRLTKIATAANLKRATAVKAFSQNPFLPLYPKVCNGDCVSHALSYFKTLF